MSTFAESPERDVLRALRSTSKEYLDKMNQAKTIVSRNGKPETNISNSSSTKNRRHSTRRSSDKKQNKRTNIARLAVSDAEHAMLALAGQRDPRLSKQSTNTIKNVESLQLSDATGPIFEMLNARDQLDLLVTERCAVLWPDGLRQIASQLDFNDTTQQLSQTQQRHVDLASLSQKLHTSINASTYVKELRTGFGVDETNQTTNDGRGIAPVMVVTDSARLFVQAFQCEQNEFEQAAMHIQNGQTAAASAGDEGSGLVARIRVNGVACVSSDQSRSPQALMAAQLLLSDKSLPPSRARQLADEYMDVVRKWYTAPFRQHTVASVFACSENPATNIVQVPALSREARVTVDVHVGVGLFGGGWGLGARLRVETGFNVYASLPATRRRQFPFSQSQPLHGGRLARLLLKVENSCLVRTLLARGPQVRAALNFQQVDGQVGNQSSNIVSLSPSNDIAAMLNNNTNTTIRLVGVSRDGRASSPFEPVSLPQSGDTEEGKALVSRAIAPHVRRRLRQIPRAEQQDSGRFAAYSWLLSKGASEADTSSPSSNTADFVFRPGQQHATANGFNAILLPGLVDLVRVAKVCCSWYHTTVLTDVGIVFTWGNGADGALGHGDTDTRLVPTAVDSLLDAQPPVLMTDIACGSDLVGAHTAAVSTTGKLYMWGTPTALGLGSQHVAQPACPVPQLVNRDLFTRASRGSLANEKGEGAGDEEEDEGEDEDQNDDRNVDRNQEGDRQVVGIACGGGFTVATTAAGSVFAWGQWANGRLGLGTAPILDKRGTASGHTTSAQQQQQNTGQQKRKRVQRYQLSPRWLASFGRVAVVDAMCGDGHVVALSSVGELYTWGKNAFGQLGNGSLEDLMSPKKLTRFLGAEPTPSTLKFLNKKVAPLPVFVKVTCGSFHSAAVDSAGLLYTWGASGSSTLGHGEPDGGNHNKSSSSSQSSSATSARVVNVPMGALNTSKGDRAMKMAAAQSALQGSGVEVNEHLYLVHTQPWRWPRAVYFFARNKIAVSQVSAGVQHMAVVSAVQGSTFVWGDPEEKNELRFARVREKQLQSSGGSEEGAGRGPLTFPAEPTLLLHQNQNQNQAWGYGRGDTEDRAVDALAEDVCVEQVACGGWQIMVSTSGSRLGRELLVGYRRAQQQAPVTSLLSNNNNNASKWLDLDEKDKETEHSLTDVRIVVGNRVIRAHAVVVAARCPVLARKIDIAKLSAASPREPLQVMMPDVSVKIAVLMIDFMYGGNVTTRLDPTSPLGVALGTAAADYGMNTLAVLCKQAVMDPSLIGNVDEHGNSDRYSGDDEGEGMRVVPRTLKRDMGYFVNNDKWADVQIIAESGDDHRILHAHEFILQSRSDTLRQVLRPLSAAPDDVSRQLVKRLYVPETRPCFLDLMWYLYTGSLSHIATTERMTSLWVAADRYKLNELKLRCEASIRPTLTNCCRLLQMSALMRNSTLVAPTIAFAAKNLATLESTRAFSMLWRLHPLIVADIAQTRQGWASSERALGLAWADDGGHGGEVAEVEDVEAEDDSTKEQGAFGKVKFPWAVGAALTMLFIGSLMLTRLDPAVLRYVPFANGIMLAGCVVYCVKYLSG